MTAVVCRFCGASLSRMFADLGEMPLANAYVPLADRHNPDRKYPLRVRVCDACHLVQAEAPVDPADIFSHYAYFSSYSDAWVAHAKRFTEHMVSRFGFGSQSFVVEVASNDGYLLRHFVEAGVPVLGVEPAANVAEVARAAGVPTVTQFFGAATAADLVADGKAADLVVGNNVLAHVPDINDFVRGLATLVRPEGVISLEFPHLLRLIEEVQFDTIYHEHFYYLSLLAVERIFAQHGLRVFDVAELPTHGGSLRVLACRTQSRAHPTEPGVAKVRDDEAAAGLHETAVYMDFQRRIEPIRAGLMNFLESARRQGKSVVAYGAAAKGNTLLNFCGVSEPLIGAVVDRSPHKQGHLLPGSRLPVLAPEMLLQSRPDYVLILPWNLKDEILETHRAVQDYGGRFVVAVPELAVLQ